MDRTKSFINNEKFSDHFLMLCICSFFQFVSLREIQLFGKRMGNLVEMSIYLLNEMDSFNSIKG